MLDGSWRETLESVARANGLPFGVGAADSVRRLSDAYNVGRPIEELGARLAFFFARDVPKATFAVRELDLRAPLKLLDLGAGLGAATGGVVQRTGPLDATLVDRDEGALALARDIAKARGMPIRTALADAATFQEKGFDLAIAENVLCEMDNDGAEQVERWLACAPTVVIIEPALRSQTRKLHEVRGKCIALGIPIVAPCLHARSCPMLAKESDWCHEDVAVDLPDWLAPVARAAGLRWEGLTFSYLVVGRGETLGARHPASFRAVSQLVSTKGKMEVRLCGTDAVIEARRLDRHRTPENTAFEAIERGDILTLSPSPTLDGSVRVSREQRVSRVVPIDYGARRR
jgi:SAM-dependent methyltransferase